MNDYEIAYHNAHMDPTNPAKWEALHAAAKQQFRTATTEEDGKRWDDTVVAARLHVHVARHLGVNPLSEEGRDFIADRLRV